MTSLCEVTHSEAEDKPLACEVYFPNIVEAWEAHSAEWEGVWNSNVYELQLVIWARPYVTSEMSSLDVWFCILLGVVRLEVGKKARCHSRTVSYFLM